MATVLTPQASHLSLDAVSLSPHPEHDTYQFPDGEVYIQLDTAGMDAATVVHAGGPDPNGGMMTLHGILQRLKNDNISTRVVFTYMPYSRQDAVFFPGTLNRAQAIIRSFVDFYGVESVAAVTPHFAGRDWVEEVPFTGLNARPLIESALPFDDYVVVGPDAGAGRRFTIPSLAKERAADQVSVTGDVDVAGCNVVVLDDMIASGGTMIAAYDTLIDQGADQVAAAAVHGVDPDGVTRVADRFDDLVLANTVSNDAATVDITPLIEDYTDI